MVSLLILFRSFAISVNSGFRNINRAANIQLLFTSCSKKKCLIVNCPMWCKVQNISQSRARCFPHDSWSYLWEKYSKPLWVFPSSFNRKYVHKVACTVVFVEPALFVFNAYPVRNANCPLSSCSNKNDGPITVNNNNNIKDKIQPIIVLVFVIRTRAHHLFFFLSQCVRDVKN